MSLSQEAGRITVCLIVLGIDLSSVESVCLSRNHSLCISGFLRNAARTMAAAASAAAM